MNGKFQDEANKNNNKREEIDKDKANQYNNANGNHTDEENKKSNVENQNFIEKIKIEILTNRELLLFKLSFLIVIIAISCKINYDDRPTNNGNENNFDNINPNLNKNEQRKKRQNLSHDQTLLNELIKINKEIYEFHLLSDSYNELIKDKSIIKDINNFKNKYYNYLNISRFAIPIIGSISAGKSTLLNYLLQLKNLLEIGEGITTEFFSIIRHNKNYKEPVISNIKVEERDFFKYNFIKAEEIVDDKYFIIKYNEKLRGIKDKQQIKIDEFFKLIEVDIPLFHGDFEKYADLIEFIDIPGLDENNRYLQNFYISQIFPFIQPNYLFSIFLFDKFESEDSNQILDEFKKPPSLECILDNKKFKDEKEKGKKIKIKFLIILYLF